MHRYEVSGWGQGQGRAWRHGVWFGTQWQSYLCPTAGWKVIVWGLAKKEVWEILDTTHDFQVELQQLNWFLKKKKVT